LIPAKGLEDANALPVDYDFKDPNEFDRFERVRDKEAEEYDSDSLWFWNDEDMARRLAGYLRPVKDLKKAELPARREEVKVEQTSSRGFWGRKRSTSKAAERPALIEERNDVKDAELNAVGQDKVLMEVKAKEVVFRTENDFGIYETKRGYGIILKLKVVLGGQ